MKKTLITSILFVFGIVLIVDNQSCTKDSMNKVSDESVYSYQSDSLFAPLDLAINIAENINKSGIVLKTAGSQNLKSAKYMGKRKIRNSLTILDKELKNPYFMC